MDEERIDVISSQNGDTNKDLIEKEKSTDLQDFTDTNSGLIEKVSKENEFALYRISANNHEKIVNNNDSFELYNI